MRKKLRRGGSVDLLLVAIVVVAVFVRTPLGGIGEWMWCKATGAEGADELALTSYFEVSSALPQVVASVDAAVVAAASQPSIDGRFPEPYRSAASLALAEQDLPQGYSLAAGLTRTDAHLANLDTLHRGNPESTLEVYAIGEDLRKRAISRARASGAKSPETYTEHRRYLPEDAMRRADAFVTGTLGTASVLSLEWPVGDEFRVSSGYGYRTHPTLKTQKLHNGVDLAVPIGTPVVASQSGRITAAKEDAVNGKYVVIDHANGVRTSYCHLSALEVEAGDRVTRGLQIGRSGNTGRSTGPHLHFVLRVAGKTVDPERFRPTPPTIN